MFSRRSFLANSLGTLSLTFPAAGARGEEARRGEVRYAPAENENGIPEKFRLAAHTFAFAEEPVSTSAAELAVSRVTFPSPVATKYLENNTVHAEYFRLREGRDLPVVIVLHILGGDFPLARLCATTLAQRGVACLFVKMPYYGPRRPAGGARKMVSDDPRETVEGMTQAILDIRRATAWLAAQAEVDRRRLGAFGISLGGITAALATTLEPRIERACLVLAGGDIGSVDWESPELAKVRKKWTEGGHTREEFVAVVKEIDPLTYAANARGRQLLMLNAKSDEVIPRACTESLWTALGKPEIVWFEGGHYSVARHIFEALDRAAKFFTAPVPLK